MVSSKLIQLMFRIPLAYFKPLYGLVLDSCIYLPVWVKKIWREYLGCQLLSLHSPCRNPLWAPWGCGWNPIKDSFVDPCRTDFVYISSIHDKQERKNTIQIKIQKVAAFVFRVMTTFPKHLKSQRCVLLPVMSSGWRCNFPTMFPFSLSVCKTNFVIYK